MSSGIILEKTSGVVLEVNQKHWRLLYSRGRRQGSDVDIVGGSDNAVTCDTVDFDKDQREDEDSSIFSA